MESPVALGMTRVRLLVQSHISDSIITQWHNFHVILHGFVSKSSESTCFRHQMVDLYKKWTDTRQMKSGCKPCSGLDIHSGSSSCSGSLFGSGYLCSGSNSCKGSSLCSGPCLAAGATFAAGPAFTQFLRGLLTYWHTMILLSRHCEETNFESESERPPKS